MPKSRDRLFKNNPLTSKVQRTSYQDSNIFGYKDSADLTVQGQAAQGDKEQKLRSNPTFNSRVFTEGTVNEDNRPASRSRREEKWNSTIFEGPIAESPRRRKLGQKDSGTENLFGKEKCDFENKSNHMPVLG